MSRQRGLASITGLVLTLHLGCQHRLRVELGARVDGTRDVAVHVGAVWMPGIDIDPVHIGLGVGAEYDSNREVAAAMSMGAIGHHGRLAYSVVGSATSSRLAIGSLGLGAIVHRGEKRCSPPLMFEMHLSETCKQGLAAVGGQVGVVSDGRVQLSLFGDLFEMPAE